MAPAACRLGKGATLVRDGGVRGHWCSDGSPCPRVWTSVSPTTSLDRAISARSALRTLCDVGGLAMPSSWSACGRLQRLV